jgi:hypothetical protein
MNRKSSQFVPYAFSLAALLCSLVTMLGCSAPTTSADLVPATIPANLPVQKMDGSVSVRTSVPSHTTNPTYVSMDVHEWIDGKKLKEAIEKSIVQHRVFSEVSQEKADYLLEVWVDKIQNVLEISGEGFVFDFLSVWRLTRASDGKVVVCEFVKGHGASRGFAARAYPPSVSAATRDMVQRGLFAVSDQSQSHLSAVSTAGKRNGI